MLKSHVITEIDERQFIAKLDEMLNTKSIHSIKYSIHGGIKTALIITNEGKDNETRTRRKTSTDRVSTKSNSDNKSRSRNKRKDAEVS